MDDSVLWEETSVERALVKVLAAEGLGGSGESLHLGVRGHVVEGLGEVVRLGQNATLANNDGPNGYLVGLEGALGFQQGHPHIAFVIVLGWLHEM